MGKKSFTSEAKAASDSPKKDVLAVIDVGGSSISLEFRWRDQPFKKDKKGLPEKSKEFCRLSQSIGKSGNICEEGKNCALKTLKEFQKQIKALEKQGHNVEVKAIGTAPFRDAKNGKKIAEEIRTKTGVALETINGKQEAWYVGLGALANLGDEAENFSGIIIDTGGGSSEFVLIEDGEIKETASLPIGNVRLQSIQGRKEKENFIKQNLDELPDAFRRNDLAVVLSGGGNRAVTKAFRDAYRQGIDDPLKRTTVSMREIFSYAQSLALAADINKPLDPSGKAEKMRAEKLSEILGVKAERINMLPEISLLIESLGNQLGYQAVRLLKSTTRDGVRVTMLAADQNMQLAPPAEDAHPSALEAA